MSPPKHSKKAREQPPPQEQSSCVQVIPNYRALNGSKSSSIKTNVVPETNPFMDSVEPSSLSPHTHPDVVQNIS